MVCAFQDAYALPCLEYRSHGTSHWLVCIGDRALYVHTELLPEVHQVTGVCPGDLYRGDLRTGTGGDVYQKMGRTDGDLLAHDGCQHLCPRIDSERMLDLDDHVIDGREVHRTSPCEHTAHILGYGPEAVSIDDDIAEGLHEIGCTACTADRTGRELGDHYPLCRHDGHDDGCDLVTGYAPETVEVEHGLPVELDYVPGLGHGLGEICDLVDVHAVYVQGGEPCGDLDLGQFVLQDVRDDRVDLVTVQLLPIHLPAYGTD